MDKNLLTRWNALTAAVVERKEQFDKFVEQLKERSSYFVAPASPGYHCNWEGGLLEHSLNVAENALRFKELLAPGISSESCVICGLFHDCLPANTRISTVNGDIPIKDVGIGDKVLFRGNGYRVINKWHTGNKKCCLVSTESGRQIETSLEHKFKVVRDGIFSYKRARDLKKGDLIVHQITSFGNIHVDRSYITGYVLGDGWLSQSDNSINVKVSEGDRYSRIRDEFLSIGGKEYKVDDCYKFYYCDKRYRELLESYGLNSYGAVHKRIPSIYYEADRDSVADLLRGIFDSDGSCSIKSDGTYINVSLGSVSRKLLLDVQYFLKKFGILATIKILRGSNTRVGSRGTTINCKNIYNLVIEGSKSLIRFRDLVGFSLKRKQERLDSFKFGYDGHVIKDSNYLLRGITRKESPFLYRRISDGKDATVKSVELLESLTEDIKSRLLDNFYTLEEVSSIVETNEKDCYDIEVDEIHQFVAEGFEVHNCGKAPLDWTYYLPKEPTFQQKKYGYVPYPQYKYNTEYRVFMTVPQYSVRAITQYIPLTDLEYQAILIHDGQYVEENSPYACKENPLALILHYADSWSGFIVEGSEKQSVNGKSYVKEYSIPEYMYKDFMIKR